MADPYNLQRFLNAQSGIYPSVLNELAAGAKRTHWMWFAFPQIRGLGRSATAQQFAIQSADEARAYLAHPLLGARLRECTRTVLGVEGRSIQQVFGSIDAMKFRSCMTLFQAVDDDAEKLFGLALEKYCGGERDALTLEILER